MDEESHRQSRLCRLLENPVAFTVVELLAENRELTPNEIARAVGRSVQRVSSVLGALRLGRGRALRHGRKAQSIPAQHPSEVRSVLAALSRFVKAASAVGR